MKLQEKRMDPKIVTEQFDQLTQARDNTNIAYFDSALKSLLPKSVEIDQPKYKYILSFAGS